MLSCRRSVRQLRGPPFERDDLHRELEGASIERLRELRDSYKIVAQPLIFDRPARLSRRAETAQPRSMQVLVERVRFVEHAAPPVQTTVELDVAIDDLCVCARVDITSAQRPSTSWP